MMHTVQLAIADPVYRASLREALLRTGPWQVESIEVLDPSAQCVLVMDEESLDRIGLPLPYPERVVLLTGKDPQKLAQAWEAGIVSVVSACDPPGTVLLAIMAAALRVPKLQPAGTLSGFSPSHRASCAPISPHAHPAGAKRCKTQ
jgi:hypothetical protein